MENLTVHIVGLPPGLLTNAPTMLLASTDGPKTRKIPTPEAEAEAGVYRVGEHFGHPMAAFRKAAIHGAKGRKVGRTGLNTILLGALFADPDHEYAVLLDPESREPLTSYEIDVRRAVPPGQGAVKRARPLFRQWAADVHLLFDEEITDEKAIVSVVAAAGKSIGAGNLRPEKGGSHGRWVVTGWTTADGVPHHYES